MHFSGLTVVLCGLSVGAASSNSVKFYCMHSSDPTYKETGISAEEISKNLDLKLKFAFYVHGWKSKFSFDDEDSTSYKIGLEWVKADKTNFCGVDWRELAGGLYPTVVAKQFQVAGNQLALFLAKLKELDIDMNSVSIAGHSLGAHVAGFAGKRIYELVGSKISTIFGLDPAGPFFTMARELLGAKHVLCKDDANFVQVLHTSVYTLGSSELLGDADFTVNNGIIQAPCLSDLFKAPERLLTCGHGLANDIFLFSFTHPCSGLAEEDNSKGTDVFGIHNSKESGDFQLKVTKSEPYCGKADPSWVDKLLNILENF